MKADHPAIGIIERLIACPTVSRDSNMKLIAFVCDLLADVGIKPRLFENKDGTKANLLATIGPEDVPGIMVSGHTDVVPVDGQDWSHDPFSPWIEDGKLYGRGACDMKGFIGLVLSLLPQISAAKLKAPIHIALSYDEEVGCAGVRSLADHLADIPVKPRFALVGEPTEMSIVTAHKGICVQRTHIHGKAAHSSLPEEGANALFAAAKLLTFLEGLAQEAKSQRDERFYPPYTSFNAGRLEGGTAVNIIADHAVIDWEYRPIPGADPEEVLEKVRRYAKDHILPDLRRHAADADIRFETQAMAPALNSGKAEEAENLLRRILGQNSTKAVSFTTEAGIFQTVSDIPALVCGPGSIAQAHKPDEYVSLDQLDRALSMLDAIVDEVRS